MNYSIENSSNKNEFTKLKLKIIPIKASQTQSLAVGSGTLFGGRYDRELGLKESIKVRLDICYLLYSLLSGLCVRSFSI